MPKLKTIEREQAAERTAEFVARELDDMRAELTAAQNALVDLQNRRRAALLTSTIAEIAAFDAGFGLADARIDRAEALIKALQAELVELSAADDGAERESNFERANALADEAQRLIVGQYAHHAAAVAKVLGRVAEIRREVAVLSENLPGGIAAIDPEEFRGYAKSLADVVRLPSVIAADMDYWPPRRAPQRADINDIYARV